jgi:6-phosphogluconolactonase
MPHIQNFNTPAEVAEAAVLDAVTTLNSAIDENGSAVWVLAGGSSPTAAYKAIAANHQKSVDWSKVTVLIGDERCVPTSDPDSNWGQISQVLFDSSGTSKIQKLQPETDYEPEEAARRYASDIDALPKTADGCPRLDLVWLGVGEDGHTLSLFPGHPDNVPTDALVIPVYNSPKPPANRITISTHGLNGTAKAVIFAVGAAKREALSEAIKYGQLPVAQVASSIEKRGGEVAWLFDQAARSQS